MGNLNSTAPLPTEEARERAFLFGVNNGGLNDGSSPARARWSIDESLAELALLARTAGLQVTGRSHQNLKGPLPPSYMGAGKLEEITGEMSYLDTSTLIIDDELSPGQQRTMERLLPDHIKLIDRTVLILDIKTKANWSLKLAPYGRAVR